MCGKRQFQFPPRHATLLWHFVPMSSALRGTRALAGQLNRFLRIRKVSGLNSGLCLIRRPLARFMIVANERRRTVP